MEAGEHRDGGDGAGLAPARATIFLTLPRSFLPHVTYVYVATFPVPHGSSPAHPSRLPFTFSTRTRRVYILHIRVAWAWHGKENSEAAGKATAAARGSIINLHGRRHRRERQNQRW